MRMHELPLVCARLTCGSDLGTWVGVASFVMCAHRLQLLIICQIEGAVEDRYNHNDERMLPWMPATGADGEGAQECKRAAASCLRMRGGVMETIVWNDARDGWRL
jgi:hypothetical protein